MKKAVLFLCLSLFSLFSMAIGKYATGDNSSSRPTQELIVQDSTTQMHVIPVTEHLEAVKDSLEVTKANNKDLQEFKELILGGLDWVDYVAGFIFALLGMLIRWYITTRKGVKTSIDTPNKFSPSFWIKDNLKDKLLTIFGTIAIIFVFMRFPYDLAGWEFSMLFCLILGLFLDYFIDLLEKLKPERKPAVNQ